MWCWCAAISFWDSGNYLFIGSMKALIVDPVLNNATFTLLCHRSQHCGCSGSQMRMCGPRYDKQWKPLLLSPHFFFYFLFFFHETLICSHPLPLCGDGALTPSQLELLSLAAGRDAEAHAVCAPITVQLCLDSTQRSIPPSLRRSDITQQPRCSDRGGTRDRSIPQRAWRCFKYVSEAWKPITRK